MKQFNCPDCKLPIVTEDVNAKLCKCDFKRVELSKPKLLKQALEVHEYIKYLAQKESELEWAQKNS